MNKENCKSWNLQKEEDEQSMVELVECCPEDHHREDQNGWRGGENVETRTSRWWTCDVSGWMCGETRTFHNNPD